MVIPNIIRDKLGIKPGEILLVDEEGGKIIMEKFDVEEFIDWVMRTRKKIAKDVYRFSLEEEFE